MIPRPPKPDALIPHARAVARKLARLYPSAHCALDHSSPYQLLVAVILSAQCTDKLVNKVTPAFFQRYPDPAALARADQAEVERYIKSTGFFRNKAKSLMGCARALVEKHGGKVPASLDELTHLPGVGRKTANVVLGDAFGIPGVVVDTHVHRVSRRLGLTTADAPDKIEQDLMRLFPKTQWTILGHRMIWHGRQVCIARRPRCQECLLSDICPRIGVPTHPPSLPPLSRGGRGGQRRPRQESGAA
jgi:endonuclease-3